MALQGVLLGTARTDQIDRMIDNGVQRAQNWHDQDDSDEDASRDARAHRDLPQRRPSTIHWSHHIESSDDDSEVDTHDGLPPFHATANDKAESEHHSQDSEEDLQGARRPPKGPSPEGQTRSARWAIKGFCFLTLLLFILVSPFLLGFCMFYQRPDLVIQQSPSDTNSTDLQAGADSIVRLALNLSQNIEDSVYEFDRAVFAPCAAFWLHCELGGSRDSLFWEPYKRLSSGIDESSRGWSQEQPCLIIAGCPDQTAASDPSAFEVFQQLSDQHLWPLTQIYISIQQEVAKIEPVVPRLHKNASIEGEAIRKLMLIEEAHWAQVEASTWPSLYYFATSVYRPTVALHESDLADREQYPLLLRLALFVTQRVWDNFWTAILPETFPVSLRRRHLHIAAALGEASRVTSGAVAEIQAKGKECTQQLARVEKHLQQELYYLSGQQAPPLWVEWMRDYLEPVCVWAEGKGRVVDESQQRVDLRAIRKSLAHVDQAVSRVLQAQGSMTGWRSLVGPPSVGDKEHAGRKMLVGRVEEVAKRAEEWKEGLPER
ncbi:hypothetical protein Tdes44962_MAKER09802 [Teratosphaeria destructans]|uniref:Uncharacterized protein n=1 Tax=Teratosphaeria destructans TaxID=418781 RepID=A0A9W7SR52_9PEZI|nr:hypothetical protein Tdes44962_MAKER09802 [Teratosphaeria destructans]